MMLSDEIRYFAMEIENDPMKITLEEIIEKLKEFEKVAIDLENANEDLRKEIEEIKERNWEEVYWTQNLRRLRWRA